MGRIFCVLQLPNSLEGSMISVSLLSMGFEARKFRCILHALASEDSDPRSCTAHSTSSGKALVPLYCRFL